MRVLWKIDVHLISTLVNKSLYYYYYYYYYYSVIFCYIPFCSILFYSVLFCSSLFRSGLICSVQLTLIEHQYETQVRLCCFPNCLKLDYVTMVICYIVSLFILRLLGYLYEHVLLISVVKWNACIRWTYVVFIFITGGQSTYLDELNVRDTD